MFDLFGRGASVWSRVGSGAWPLAFVSTGHERHLAAAAKLTPEILRFVRFDTVFRYFAHKFLRYPKNF